MKVIVKAHGPNRGDELILTNETLNNDGYVCLFIGDSEEYTILIDDLKIAVDVFHQERRLAYERDKMLK